MLETSTRLMDAAINDRNFEHPIFALAISEFECGPIDEHPGADTLAGMQKMFQDIATENPAYNIEVESMRTDMSSCGQYAEVHQQLTVTGKPLGLTRSVFSVVAWEKIEGQWRAVSHHSLLNFLM